MSRTERKPPTLTILTKPTQRQLVKRLHFHLRLIAHVWDLAEGDSDPKRSSFIRAALNLEGRATRRLIARLGGKSEEKERAARV